MDDFPNTLATALTTRFPQRTEAQLVADAVALQAMILRIVRNLQWQVSTGVWKG
jgi:hypothetical protein